MAARDMRRLALLLLLPALVAMTPAGNQRLTAQGTVTLANLRLSAVNGTAFLDFSAADVLTTHIGNLIVLTDSAGHSIRGYAKAAGTGETYSAELVDSWTNNVTYPFEVFTSVGSDITRAANTSGTGLAWHANVLVAWASYHCAYAVAGVGQLQVLGYLASSENATAPVLRIGSSGGSQDLYLTTHAAYTHSIILDIFDTSVDVAVNGVTLKQVLTPAATGVTITSTKGGSTYNFANQEASFNYNDASGYSYRIFKVSSAPVVASGIVTPADTRLSLIDGTAFAWLNGVDLSPYQDGRHMLSVYDSSGHVVSGFISATPPAGETLGAELVDSWTNGGSWPYETFTSVGSAISEAANTTGLGLCTHSETTSDGPLYYCTSTLTLNSGSALNEIIWGKDLGGGVCPIYIFPRPHSGAQTRYFTGRATCADVLNKIALWSQEVTNLSISGFSLKQVTDCPATGALIVSDIGGATRNWNVSESSFNPNGASNYTYKIFFVGN